MSKNYEIIGKFIKDMSSETPDVETYVYVKDYIANYKLNIDIVSKPLNDLQTSFVLVHLSFHIFVW